MNAPLAGSECPFPFGKRACGKDDIRKIVWRAYARTGQLLVREAEQGITDKITLVVDTSGKKIAGKKAGQSVWYVYQAKRAGREVLDGRGNQLWAYVDKPREWDAWDVDAAYAGSAADERLSAYTAITGREDYYEALQARYPKRTEWMSW